MFSIHASNETSVTFHFDKEGETPRRFHVITAPTGKWRFVTDLCHSKPRQPGIPEELRGKTFNSKEEAAFAVISLNTIENHI